LLTNTLIRFGDQTGLDIIYNETDPRYFQAEIDTYWIQHGGGNPVAWIARMNGRMPVIHLKDMAIAVGSNLAGTQIMSALICVLFSLKLNMPLRGTTTDENPQHP